MKERPILCGATDVRAILAGTKTQTRRAVKHPALATLSYVVDCGEGWWGDEEGEVRVRCPYGQPGDRLWVRETFSTSGLTRYHYTGNPNDHGGPDNPCCAYAATGTYMCGKMIPDGALASGAHRWRPSIHMPRWASRITLEITGVRVERLQDISEGDAKAEGVIRPRPLVDDDPCTHIDAFGDLWESINGPGSWERNPLVWVREFRRVTP